MTEVWEGAEALRELLVPIDSLHPHPRNPRRGVVPQIQASLKRFGQVRPVLAQPDGTIVAGNHTWKAAVAEGWTHIAAVQHEFATAEDARAYLLADNRLPELGGYDREQLVGLLDEIDAADAWEGTGYLPDDLDQLRALDQHAATVAPTADPPAPLGPVETREVVLLLDNDTHASFGQHVRTLRTEYEMTEVTETVLAAVHNEALRANQEPT